MLSGTPGWQRTWSVAPSRRAERTAALWARTQEELDLGRFDGPFTVEDHVWRAFVVPHALLRVEQNDTLRV
tara:strand:+ start:910 stop:1122 length:213 start_codon:yes stop_codon:yes gene_type:complete